MFLALQLLHKYDFVHRDISTANIFCLDGQGKVGDLEYTKKQDLVSSHEIRTVG